MKKHNINNDEYVGIFDGKDINPELLGYTKKLPKSHNYKFYLLKNLKSQRPYHRMFECTHQSTSDNTT